MDEMNLLDRQEIDVTGFLARTVGLCDNLHKKDIFDSIDEEMTPNLPNLASLDISISSSSLNEEGTERISVFKRNTRTTSSIEAYNLNLGRKIHAKGHKFKFVKCLIDAEYEKSRELALLFHNGGLGNAAPKRHLRDRAEKIMDEMNLLDRQEIDVTGFLARTVGLCDNLHKKDIFDSIDEEMTPNLPNLASLDISISSSSLNEEGTERISVFKRNTRTTSSIEAYNLSLGKKIHAKGHTFKCVKCLIDAEYEKSREFALLFQNGGIGNAAPKRHLRDRAEKIMDEMNLLDRQEIDVTGFLARTVGLCDNFHKKDIFDSIDEEMTPNLPNLASLDISISSSSLNEVLN
ncbi:uncharacterized protein [Drosophila takahashii]|uniref:uncharacterized protein n=1 Tax=Drosophila takahashii TaxID=29030 RepID=UPI003898DC68